MTSFTHSKTSERPAPRLAKPAAAVRRTLFIFHLGDQAYALPLSEVAELVPMAQLSRPPGLPAVVAGFLNLGGTAVPVVRLDRLFELPEMTTELYTPLLILRHMDSPLALLVERVSRIVQVAEENILPLPESHSFNDCAEGLVRLEGVTVLLSAGRILLEKEQQCLAEFQDREQSRLRQLEVSGS